MSAINESVISMSDVPRTFKYNFNAGVALMLMGASGIGKTELALEYANQQGDDYGFFEINLATASLPDLIGLQMPLKIGASENGISSGWFLALDLPNPDGSSGSGANDYRDNIKNCNGTVFQIGDTLNVDSEQGNMIGPTKQGVEGGGPGGMGLKEKDPGAFWNSATNSIQGSCAPGICADGLYHATSPRVVPVALFDIDAFFAGSPQGKSTVTITNIMGYFIEGMGGSGNKDVIGRLVTIPALKAGSTVTETASFMRKVRLVR